MGELGEMSRGRQPQAPGPGTPSGSISRSATEPATRPRSTEPDLDPPSVKIAFLAEDGLVENMFAEPLISGEFRLDNIPFHVFGISWGDEFAVRVEDGRLFFDRVTRRGGHSTYRVKLPAGAPHEAFMREWPYFDELGCGFEGSNLDARRLYAIDIPAGADVHAIYDRLAEVEVAGLWEFEEGHYDGATGS